MNAHPENRELPPSFRVAIADDHELIRVGVAKIIRSRPDLQLVGAVSNLDELLLLLSSTRPDILVLDLHIPPYDDLSGLEKVHAAAPGLPVIVLSMYPENRFAVDALRKGAVAYISKATAAEELVTAIYQVMSIGSYISPVVAALLAAEIRTPRPIDPLERLTPRESQIAQLIAQGLAVKQIAAQIELSISSVNTYRMRIFNKLGIRSNAALIRLIVQRERD